MVYEKVPSTKEDLLTAIQENWNPFDKEYYPKFLKSMPKTINAVINSWGGAPKY